MKRFDDKIVLVTGGGSGIGCASACRLAVEGATVVVNDVTHKRAEATLDDLEREGHAIGADVSDRQAVDDMYAEIVDRYGRIDAVANVAGIPWGEPVKRSASVRPSRRWSRTSPRVGRRRPDGTFS